MSKQLNVNLQVDADVSRAKAQFQDLQNTLRNLASTQVISPNTFNTQHLKEGVQAAKELQSHLRAATDVNTGKLNLSAFSASLKSSGKSLSEYKTQLERLGPTGQDAFLKVSKSIATADAPLRQTNKYLTEFATTLKNTARWQISSSLLHGFMGTISSAVGYAKDLNKSLTDIRIVTGQNTEQMAEFAEKANKAAKALSTTTNQYAKASLIYFQQGLEGQEVQDRADITIKMAHASGQSAEIVSDQLTAVWNNFAKGGENLEHYADVMTALGAATASSSDEIAGGLEKFASIAEMIGLSYEYAASALATITATTRQSEDVVGTALKTIFARIQGLNLGETLDDGTTLNKYSQALEKIGISIYEQNGELKDMDNILNEMGAKWNDLSKDQQVALAQTVAGVRQYNQLVSLMDNWDFMQQNVDLSLNSDGTLQEQADIYEESWRAASDRVRASLEGVYDSLLDDEFFITLTNGLAKLIEGVEGFADGVGGMEGAISIIGGFITQKLAKEAPVALNRIHQNLLQITGQAHQIATETQNDNLKFLANEGESARFNMAKSEGTSAAYAAEITGLEKLGILKQQYIQYSERLNSVEKANAESLIAEVEQMTESIVHMGQEYDKLKSITDHRMDMLFEFEGTDELFNKLTSIRTNYEKIHQGKMLVSKIKTFDKDSMSAEEYTNELKIIEKQLRNLGIAKKQLRFNTIKDAFDNNDLTIIIEKITNKMQDLGQKTENTTNKIKAQTIEDEKLEKLILSIIKSLQSEKEQLDKVSGAMVRMRENTEQIEPPRQSISQAFTQMASAAMQFNAVLNSMKTFKDVFSNEDATILERFSALIGLITTALFFHNSVVTLSTNLIGLENKTRAGSIITKKLDAMTTAILTKSKAAEVAITEEQAAANAALKLSYGSLLGVMLAVTAAIYLIKTAYDAYKESTPEAQLEKMSEKATEATNHFKEAEQAYQDLMSTIKDYDNADKALDGLVKGTIEYREQLLKTNETAMELIGSLGLVYGSDYEYDGDRIKINEEALERKQEEKLALAEQARAYSMQVSQSVRNKKTENKVVDYAESIPSFSSKQKIVNDELYGATGNNIQYIDNTKSDAIIEEQISAIYTLANAYEEQGNIVLDEQAATEALRKEFGDKAPELTSALFSDKEELAKLIPEIIAQKEAVIENTKALVGGANNNNTEYNNLSDEDKELADILIANNQIEKGSEEWNIAKAETDRIMSDPAALQAELFAMRGLDENNYKIEQDGANYKLYQRDATTGAWSEDAVGTYSTYEVQQDLLNKQLLQFSESVYGTQLDSLNKFESQLQSVLGSDVAEEVVRDIVKSAASGGEQIDLSALNPEQHKELQEYLEKTSAGGHRGELWQKMYNSKDAYDEESYNKKKAAMDASYNADGETKAEGLGIDVEEFKAYRDLLKDSTDIYDDNVKGLNQIALANKRMEKGVKSLADDWEDLNKIMSDETSSMEDISSILPEVNAGLQDILNLDAEQFELLPPTFAQDNWGLIQDVMNNVDGAVDALRDKAGQEILMNIEGTVDADGSLNAQLTELHNSIAAMDAQQFEVGVAINPEDHAAFIENCNALIAAAGMTAEQAQAYFASMGYDVELKEISPEKEDISTYSYYELDEAATEKAGGVPQFKKTPTEIAVKSSSSATAYALESITPNGSYGGGTGVETTAPKSSTSGKSKGGGGGKKSTPAEKVDYTKKSDVVDRYKEIDDTLNDIEKSMSKVNKEADRMFGSARLKQMEKEKNLLLQQADALKEKKRQALEYMNNEKDGDRQNLINVGAKYGIKWQFDEDGDITNYTSQMNTLYQELHAAEQKMDSLGTKEAQDEYQKVSIKPIEDKIKAIKEALSQYEDTKELLEQLDEQLQEAIWAWQDKNFEELEYKLELKLDINEAELKHLDYLMNKWSDDFFQLAESAALMYDPDKFDQVDGYSAQLEAYRDFEKSVREQYAAGDISQADYIDGLKQARDGYYEQLEALTELDKTMTHYYEDTLSAAKEELDDYTDHMEHITGVFDHYMNIMDLLGKQKDYETIGNFLGGKAETARDELEVAKEYYDMLLDQKDSIEAEFNKALRSGDEDSIKFWQEQWDAIVDATDEAHDEMLSKTEAWIENMRAVIQNNMEKLASDLEKALTGDFMNFDVLMDSFDKLNTRQEEYLTKTNQIYETNKLIRQASQKVDQTDNKVAKQKMENFIQETKSLQQNNQLSEYELEIQQAKYELLLAEIALEEAQNAKSTVRLSRDSEGNFGYVYTADQDAVNDAEQNLDDAKNRLYNISLDGQQNYTDKYLQAQQSMYEELTELQQMWLDGELSSEEEYQKRKEEIINHYYGENGILRTYSTLYNVAIQTDAAATADYWGKEYGEMTQHTEEWKIAVNDYLEQVEDETEEWAEVSEQANKDVEGALKNSKTATKDLTDETDKLGKEIKNDLIPAMDQELKRVEKAIIEYDKERDAIRRMREEYERYIEAINQSIKDEANKSDDDKNDSLKSDKDYSLSALINAANGDMEAAYQDINKRNEKIKDDDNYTDKTSSTTKKKVEAIEKLNDSQKESIAKSLKYLEDQGKYTTAQVDIILKQNGASFDTGGYTGEWGPEGKLAFLHQKELVLNADDTENLLKTITFIRDLVNMIDSQASFASLGAILSSPGFVQTDHNFEQNVSIYAEFPSATNHSEIEEAFNNLLNTASQYANRKV